MAYACVLSLSKTEENSAIYLYVLKYVNIKALKKSEGKATGAESYNAGEERQAKKENEETENWKLAKKIAERKHLKTENNKQRMRFAQRRKAAAQHSKATKRSQPQLAGIQLYKLIIHLSSAS